MPTLIDRLQRFALLTALLAWVLVGAWAICTQEAIAAPPPQQEYGYRTIRTSPSFIWEDEAGADSVDVSTPAETDLTELRAPKPTNGNPTVAVDTEFSSAAGDTAVITVIIWHLAVDPADAQTWTRMGVTTVTATATANRHGGAGDFVADTLYFDSSSGTHYEVRHAAPSAGTCDGTVWSYGVLSE